LIADTNRGIKRPHANISGLFVFLNSEAVELKKLAIGLSAGTYSPDDMSFDKLGNQEVAQLQLVLRLVKYFSDKYANNPGALIAALGCSGFKDMFAHKGDKEIGDKPNSVSVKLGEANESYGISDVTNFNDDYTGGRERKADRQRRGF
jgi:hypothetical protein